jgi:hypothetical protein
MPTPLLHHCFSFVFPITLPLLCNGTLRSQLHRKHNLCCMKARSFPFRAPRGDGETNNTKQQVENFLFRYVRTTAAVDQI